MRRHHLSRSCRCRTTWRNVTAAALARYGVLAILCGFLGACSLSDLVDNAKLPPDVRDPSVVKNEAGALSAYRSALVALADALAGRPQDESTDAQSYVYYSGILTDELHADEVNIAGFPNQPIGLVDTRQMLDENTSYVMTYPYAHLHRVRGQAREARGALQKYAASISSELQGHLYAVEGFAEVLLAELYCSGIPLSQLKFDGDYVVTPGYRTDEVLQHAIALFDTALTLTGDSLRFRQFATIGRARALQGLGEYEQAAQAVAAIPDGFQYALSYATTRKKFIPGTGRSSISNEEGETGLPFGSLIDPRTQRPEFTDETASLIIASGVEARLIEAEAALAGNRPEWLTRLNRLRTSCTSGTSCPSPAPAGTGQIANLPLLDDPADAPLPPGKTVKDVRVDLLFTERAYWLFLTGHRQGDLRRLVRQYSRLQQLVYPTGQWGTAQVAVYGNDVNIPVPISEKRDNSLYQGCFDRDA